MVTVCWAAKGGSGTTVVTATLALDSGRHALLVDLDGELPAALGIPEPDRPGVIDWLLSDASPDQLSELVIDTAARISIMPQRLAGPPADTSEIEPHRWRQLAAWLVDQDRLGIDVFVDGGTHPPQPELVEVADRNLLVTRSCYLALRRAVRCAVRPSGVVLVAEPGRSLSRRDIEHALGVPVVATVSVDPAVARAVDAGLLICRPPRIICRELRPASAA